MFYWLNVVFTELKNVRLYYQFKTFSVKKLVPKKLKIIWGQGAVFSFRVPKGVIVSKVDWTYYKKVGGSAKKLTKDKRISFEMDKPDYSLKISWCTEQDIGFYKAVVTTDANEELPVLFHLNVQGERKLIFIQETNEMLKSKLGCYLNHFTLSKSL